MNAPARVFIALGSNISPRGERLSRARDLLRAISAGGWKESPIYETPPVGPEGQGPYLNQVVSFWTTRDPMRVLHFCKGAEIWLGRKPRSRWNSREIDMDLLYHGAAVQNKPPVLPHPQLHLRQFVLVPLCDLDPDWMDPLRAQSVRTLLDGLQANEGTLAFRTAAPQED